VKAAQEVGFNRPDFLCRPKFRAAECDAARPMPSRVKASVVQTETHRTTGAKAVLILPPVEVRAIASSHASTGGTPVGATTPCRATLSLAASQATYEPMRG